MFNALNMENKNMKNIMKYICLFLMVIGISVEVKGAITLEGDLNTNIPYEDNFGGGMSGELSFELKNSEPGWSSTGSGYGYVNVAISGTTEYIYIDAPYPATFEKKTQYGTDYITVGYLITGPGVYHFNIDITQTQYYNSGSTLQSASIPVTLTLTGSAYDVTYHVPSCVASPVNNTTIKSETFAAPTPSVPGYKFEGWVTSPVAGQSQRPSTVYAAGDAVTEACNAYALYSNVSAVFTRTNTLTSGKNYLIVGSYTPGGTAKAMSNETVSYNRFGTVDWETSSDNKIICRDWSCIWRFDNPSGDEWTIYNEEVGKYAGATGNGTTSNTDRAATLVDNRAADVARWTYTVNTLTNKARSSCTEKVLKLSSGYAGFYSSGSNPYLFVQEELTPNYTTNPVCDANTYTVTYNANGASGSVPTDIAQYQAGDMVTVKVKGDLEKACHTFAGWKCSKDDAIYTAGETVAMGSSNMTFTAQWSEITSSLTVDEVGIGMSAGSITEGNSDDVTCGTELALAYTNIGTNLFCGWQVVNGSGTDVTESVVNDNILTMPGYPITVSAHIFADVRWKCSADVELTGDVHLTSANGIEVFTTNFAEEPNKNIVVSMSSRGDAAKLRVRFLDSDDNEVAPADCPFALYYYGWTGSGTHNNYTQTYSGTNNYHYIDISGCADENFSQTFAVGYCPKSAGVYDTYKIKIEACNSGNTPLGNPAILTLEGRSLPEQFVIAMKNTNDNKWYALPNDLATSTSGSSSTKAPLLISVDNTTAPTKALMAPKNTLYKGYSRYDTDHRNAIRFLRADATDNAWITTSGTSLLYMPNNSAKAQDFNLRSSDLAKYTITQDGATDTIAMYGGIIGWYSSGSNKTVYLLPVDASAEPAVFDVVEWFPTKLLIESSQVITNTSVKVGDAEAVPGTASKDTYGTNLYEVQTGDLTAKAGQAMSVSYTIETTTYAKVVTVPIILSRGTYATSGSVFGGLSAKSNYKDNDLVVRDGATLTVDAATGTHNTFKNVTIYPNSKVVVPEKANGDDTKEVTMTTTTTTLFGGIDEIYDGSEYTLTKYGVPQLVLNGKLVHNETTSGLVYDVRVDEKQYYNFALPYTSMYELVTDHKGAYDYKYWVKVYDGQTRAETGNGWVWYNWNADPWALNIGTGYMLEAQSNVGQNYVILRHPLGYSNTGGKYAQNLGGHKSGTAEETKAAITVTAPGMVDGEIMPGKTANNVGWNFIANPFMANFSKDLGDGSTGTIQVGKLEEHIEGGKWNGKYDWDTEGSKNVRYVTLYNNGTDTYTQLPMSDTVLAPFTGFFVQIAKEGTIVFDINGRVTEAPARMLSEDELPSEMEIFLHAACQGQKDDAVLFINDDLRRDNAKEFPNEMTKQENANMLNFYTFGGDEVKMYANGMSYEDAQGWSKAGVKVATAGEYTFSVTSDQAEYIQQVILRDMDSNTEYDLMSNDATIYLDKGEMNDRFYVKIVFGKHNIGTGTGEMYDNRAPEKFILNDHMYIRANGVLFDGVGKRVK